MFRVWLLQHASLTPRVRKFYDFCLQAGKLHPNGSPCPAEEWTLCLFVSFLDNSIHESLPSHLSDTIHLALDLSIHDHCMFWAACTLAYFRFLHSAEFTVPNLASFLPTIRLTVADIAVDSMVSPSCLRVRIKASKTDPFQVGFYVHVGLGRAPLCALQAMLAFLALRGNSPGPLFLLQSGQPLTRTPGGKASMYVL